jgi:hypothetical protein
MSNVVSTLGKMPPAIRSEMSVPVRSSRVVMARPPPQQRTATIVA